MCLSCITLTFLLLQTDVKLSAEEIWKNLHFPDGSLVIPNNSFVYIATDDPDGICKGCLVNRKPCEEYPIPKPVGCPLDVIYTHVPTQIIE